MRYATKGKLLASDKNTPLSELSGPNCIPIYAAQNITKRARELGVLVPEPCWHCGANERIEAHHRNYYRPLDVTWLCKPCHGKEHSRLYRAKIIILGSQTELNLQGSLRRHYDAPRKEDAA